MIERKLAKRKSNDQLLQDGRQRLINGLGIRLPVLLRKVDEERSMPGSPASQEIYSVFHTLKGSAPVFGLGRIGSITGSLAELWEPEHYDALTESAKLAVIDQSALFLDQLQVEYEIGRKEIELHDREVRLMHPISSTISRILVIDDDDVLRNYLCKRLEMDRYHIQESDNVEQGKKLLREHNFDLIILDLMMFPQSGYELFEFLKEDPTFKWIPLIVLSGRSDLQDKVQCFYLGADDYVTKPFQYEELLARIHSLLKRNHSFEQMAFRDPLTGVFNRRYLDQQIQSEMQRIQRYPAPITVAFIDIDRFKLVNDTYGHAVGDIVLQGLAGLLQSRLRLTDLVARYGGEEFVVVLPGTTESEALPLIQSILDTVRNTAIARVDNRDYQITFSAGIAQFQSHYSTEQWLHAADEAMYESKKTGRNRITIAAAEQLKNVQPEQPSNSKRLLIADDDEIIRTLIIHNLSHLPIDIVVANDGEEALRYLLNESIDVCILDGLMPRVDGFQLLEKLHESEQTVKTKIIMLSGNKSDSEMVRAITLGADEYMSKPFSVVELELRIKRLLGLLSTVS